MPFMRRAFVVEFGALYERALVLEVGAFHENDFNIILLEEYWTSFECYKDYEKYAKYVKYCEV